MSFSASQSFKPICDICNEEGAKADTTDIATTNAKAANWVFSQDLVVTGKTITSIIFICPDCLAAIKALP